MGVTVMSDARARAFRGYRACVSVRRSCGSRDGREENDIKSLCELTDKPLAKNTPKKTIGFVLPICFLYYNYYSLHPSLSKPLSPRETFVCSC
jgi:hypothetical protein